jgi:hypothetical protein
MTACELGETLAFGDEPEAGDRVALKLRIGPAARHRDVTFRELCALAASWGGAFRALGCRPGQRLALLSRTRSGRSPCSWARSTAASSPP